MTTQTTPIFSTAASTGQTLGSESFRGKVPVAMFFLPDATASSETLATTTLPTDTLRHAEFSCLPWSREGASDARALSERARTTFPLFADPSTSILREFGAIDESGDPVPCSVIIDKTGTVASKTEGVLSVGEMTAQLDDLVKMSRFEMAVNR